MVETPKHESRVGVMVGSSHFRSATVPPKRTKRTTAGPCAQSHPVLLIGQQRYAGCVKASLAAAQPAGGAQRSQMDKPHIQLPLANVPDTCGSCTEAQLLQTPAELSWCCKRNQHRAGRTSACVASILNVRKWSFRSCQLMLGSKPLTTTSYSVFREGPYGDGPRPERPPPPP